MKREAFFKSKKEKSNNLSPSEVKKFSRGAKVDEISTITDIAKSIREYVKKKYPDCKFSITTEKYSGGQSLSVYLMQAPFNPLKDESKWDISSEGNKYYSVNYNYIEKNENLSDEAKKILQDVRSFYNKYNYNHSDPMTDYFNVRFYESMGIGRWDKGFEQTVKKGKTPTPRTPKDGGSKGDTEPKFKVGEKVEYKTKKGTESGIIKNFKYVSSVSKYLYFIENPRGGVYSVWESTIISDEKTPEPTPETPKPEQEEKFTASTFEMLKTYEEGLPDSEVGSIPIFKDKDGDIFYVTKVNENQAIFVCATTPSSTITITPKNIEIISDFEILNYNPKGSKKLKKIIVQWSESENFRVAETFNSWKEFQDKAKTVDLTDEGYVKTKVFILWENNRALMDRVDIGKSESDFYPKRDFIGDYIGNQTSAMYWSNFTSGERKNEAIWKDTEEMPKPTPEIPKSESDEKLEDDIWKKAFAVKRTTKDEFQDLRKAVYSKRRSKEDKLIISFAFGELRYFDKNLNYQSFQEFIDLRNYEAPLSKVFKFRFDEKIADDNFDFDMFSIVQSSNLSPSDWTLDMIFPQINDFLKDDKNKEYFLNYFFLKTEIKTEKEIESQPELPKDDGLIESIEILKEENDFLNVLAVESKDNNLKKEVRLTTNENSFAINEFSKDLFYTPEKMLEQYFDSATKIHSVDNSELSSEEYQKIVNSPQFINWFGDFRKETSLFNFVSKVVKPELIDGKTIRQPIIVYHGTWNRTHYSRFKFTKFPIIYFATNKSYAEWFAKLGSGIIYQCFLDIKNLCCFLDLGLTEITYTQISEYLEKTYGFSLPKKTEYGEKNPFWYWLRQDAPSFNIINTIKEQGFNGIRHVEDNPSDKLPNGENNSTIAYMIFKPEQAKLVRYVDNSNIFTDIFFMKKGGKLYNKRLIEQIKNFKI